MDDTVRRMWQAYVQENANPSVEGFIQMVMRELNCTLEEASERTKGLLLTE